jgi:uncharacterized protein YdeI (YjbR/CyaY-like superfamily)
METKKGVTLPPDLAAVLKVDPPALEAFEALWPLCQQRYVTLIEESKRPGTRERRVKGAVEEALDWKQRHDKHQRRS